MSAIQASLQKVFVECLEVMLRPIVRLTLYCGLGYTEFSAAVRRVFVDVASREYGVRGRPANISRISAKTGLPRKVVSSLRSRATDLAWSPDDEINPINTVIHYWRFDTRYCLSPGNPRDLPYEGDAGFTQLVKQYAGDIPASAIRRELIQEGIIELRENDQLSLCKKYSFPENLDEDFLRNAAFAIRHHADTVVHNALLVDSGEVSEREHREHGRFERIAWSRRLTPQDVRKLQVWVRDEGGDFILRADEFISRLEVLEDSGISERSDACGVGLYFFGS